MNFISDEFYKELASEGDGIDKMLNGYISYLKKSKQGANEPGANYSVHEVSSYSAAESNQDLSSVKDTNL
jgi:hypothetical protein